MRGAGSIIVRAILSLSLFLGGCCCVAHPSRVTDEQTEPQLITTPSPPKTTAPSQIGSTEAALGYAENYAAQYLTFPRDAEFQWGQRCKYIGDPDGDGLALWSVSGDVKAMNAFGAKVTHGYTVLMSCQVIDDVANYRCVTVALNGEVVYADDAALAAKATPEDLGRMSRDSEAIEARRANEDAEQREKRWHEEFARDKRTWRDKSGKFALEAIYAGFQPGKVFLQKSDKSIVMVELKRLSENDRRVAVKLARERGQLGNASGD